MGNPTIYKLAGEKTSWKDHFKFKLFISEIEIYTIYWYIKNTTRFQSHISINKPFKIRISKESIKLDSLVCKSRETFIITFSYYYNSFKGGTEFL